jgi:hypothetical protein
MINRAMMLVLLVMAVLLGGCASGGSAYKPEAAANGQSVIYVYGARHMFKAFAAFTVRVNGENIGNIGPEYYVAAHVKPGTHKVEIVEALSLTNALGLSPSVMVTTTSGGSAYVRGTSHPISGSPAWTISPSAVPASVGRQEIVGMTKS